MTDLSQEDAQGLSAEAASGSAAGGRTCPIAEGRVLGPDDELLFPLSKGAFAQYWQEEDGGRQLRIFYRDKEILFADPAFFAFGEALIGQSRFRAGDAISWGALEWPKVRRMLAQLIEAGVLHHADEAEAVPAPLRHEDRPSPLSPAPCPRPKTWDECGEVMRLISGEPLEIGYLELVVPVFRVAHAYLDADDRQIGEANVFPPLLRLERPALWRTCTYSGTRYQPDLPMNVTALRAMRTHWRQTMAVVRRVSDAYKARFPEVDERGWTVGDIERMTACVSALPTYLLMRREGRVENGRLHPALSSAFRLVDGPRQLMHHMIFAPYGEPARSGDTPMTGAELHAYAERSDQFRSGRGVCAGPPAMIDDVLAVMLDGADPRGGWPDSLDPDLAAALGELDPAIDYGLLGLQAYCAVFPLFSAASAAQYELWQIIAEWQGTHSPRLAALRARLERASAEGRAAGEAASAERRRSRLAAYDDLYRKCGFGLTGRDPDRSLSERYRALPPLPAETMAALEAAFARYLHDLRHRDALSASLTECLGRFIALVQATLHTALEVQRRINALLGRSPPAGPFAGRDLARFAALDGRTDEDGKRPLFLVDDIATLLGVTIDVGTEAVTVTPGASAAAADRPE